jgi:Divergent InlB B-repeat domain
MYKIVQAIHGRRVAGVQTGKTESPRDRREAVRQGLDTQGESYVRRLTILLATVAALMLVPAAQAFANGTMTVNVEGNGGGEVIGYNEYPGEPPITCGYTSPGPATGVCKTEKTGISGYEGVELEAIPAPGSVFVGWTKLNESFAQYATGACPLPLEYGGKPNQCFAYDEEFEELAWEVTAVFAKGFPLKVEKTGQGTVVSSPAGIECGEFCEYGFETGKSVTLTASPATGYAFSAWAGCTTHVGLTCTVEMSKAKTVKASFVATPSLTIEKAGSGQGKALATGISCDENCSKATSAIKTGTSVTVKATPAKGSEAAVFEGGTGSASGCSGATCTFTISENSSVKVKFDPIPTSTLTVNLAGPAKYKGKVTGKGTVKGLTASAINCGTGCTSQTESFFATDEVTLTAVAGTGYTFKGWNTNISPGTCHGATTPCTIKTSSNETLVALFE